MSQEEFEISVLSPERALFRGEGSSVGLPGKLGYMTILPGHAAMVAELDAGVMTVTANGTVERYFIRGGFTDVSAGVVTVLADGVEKISEINQDRAKKSLQRAAERLSTTAKGGSVDVERALRAKKRAEARLELLAIAKTAH